MTKNKDIYNVEHTTFTKPETFGFEDVTAPRKRSFMGTTASMSDSELASYTSTKAKYEAAQQTRTIEKTDSIVDSLINEHIERAKMGKAKYNNTLDRTDLSVIDYLQHAKEEAMDLALYLQKTIDMLQGKK